MVGRRGALEESGSYDRERFSVLRENGVHYFQALVHRALSSPSP